jgi:hypothetical protein
MGRNQLRWGPVSTQLDDNIIAPDGGKVGLGAE